MKEHLRRILKFRNARDWKQFHSPKNLALSLSLEAAEVLEIFQWTADNKLPSGKRKQAEQEIADVYYYLLLLAHETGIDINAAFKQKMKLNESRYPAEKAKGNSKKYSEF